MSNATLGVQKDFARRLSEMHHEAARLGLYCTMHKIHETVYRGAGPTSLEFLAGPFGTPSGGRQ